ncbi:MAG: 30S ribosome-binding factor RbfA [Elusimicrobia bacterium]|nr:30S ribosome-binding factor RbfA [Elusimicrobiota bacterium]
MHDRIERLEELLLREISSVLTKRLSGPPLITLTGVKLARNLESATIFYSVLGSEEEQKHAPRLLQASITDIVNVLRTRLHIRRMPKFTFKQDYTAARAQRIETILNAIHAEDKNTDNK